MSSLIGDKLSKFAQRIGGFVEGATRVGQKIAGQKTNATLPLSGEALLNAEMSAQAYEPVDKRKETIGNFTYDKDISTPIHAIYVGSGTVYLAERGTNSVSEATRNWGGIAMGKESSNERMTKLRNKVNEIKRKYPNRAVKTTGHSLGGSNVRKLTTETNIPSRSYNPGAGVSELRLAQSCSGGAKPSYCSKLTAHKILGDPASALATAGKVFIYDKLKSNAHTIYNFTDLQ
jgi:hypothetical protein